MPLPPLAWMFPMRTVFPVAPEPTSTPLPELPETVPPDRRSLVLPVTLMPTAPPLTELTLTLLLLPTTRIPYWLAPVDRTDFTVWLLVPMRQPMVPPTASGPMMVKAPVLVMFQTGWALSCAVIFATVHWVMVKLLEPPSTTFSVVWLNIPMTSPLCAAS